MNSLAPPLNSINLTKNFSLKSDSSVYTAVSVFSGCGGLDIGAELAGIEVVYATDSMNDAIESLSSQFTNTDIVHKDIRDIKSFPNADFLIGGYPCQSFSMGGKRNPKDDERSELYLEFARAINEISPLFFVAENVPGLKHVAQGEYFKEQLSVFQNCGVHGYNISSQILNAAEYGVPQKRKRLFIVGIRKDLELEYVFPKATHGTKDGLIPFCSHGEIIKDLPLWPSGEFYERPTEESTFSWYYMSRNRKALWDGPAYTVVANWRHTTLHPASPVMKITWSDLGNGFKQRWDFTDEYEHTSNDPNRPILEQARRLSWRECARIQTFPDDLELFGSTQSKFTQIGNAVPPELARVVFEGITTGSCLIPAKENKVITTDN